MTLLEPHANGPAAGINAPVMFDGPRWAFFRMSWRLGLVTVLTLGMFRFWETTAKRRYLWSAIRPMGHRLEYTGYGFEKMLGFLASVIALSFYIGVVNLVLMFLSFSLFEGNYFAYGASLLGLTPIFFFAQYRGRRYVLGSTNWRGIRFGVAPGAWGYVWRGMVYWGLTIVTLGLLWPLCAFRLEKYRWDRTFYGTQRFHQGGRAIMLYRAIWPFMLAVVFGLIGGFQLQMLNTSGAVWLVAATVLLLIAFPYAQARRFKLMHSHKTLGGTALSARPSMWRLMWIYALGGFLTLLGIALTALAVFLVALAIFGFDGFERFEQAEPGVMTILMGFIGFLALSLLRKVFWEVFVQLPLLRHLAQSIVVTAAPDLDLTGQRAQDQLRNAEGFTDALDLGISI